MGRCKISISKACAYFFIVEIDEHNITCYSTIIEKAYKRGYIMRKKVSKVIGQVLLLAMLTVFALWFALRENGTAIILQIQRLSMKWILCILVLGILYYIIQGYVLYMIAKKYNKNIQIKDGVCNAYVAAFFNGVTPLGGGQIAQTYAFRKLKMSYGDIASVLWKDFFLYQSVIVTYASILLIIGIFMVMPNIFFYYFLAIIGFFINGSVILLLWTMAKFPNIYHKITKIIIGVGYKLHIVKNQEEVSNKLDQQMTDFTKQIQLLKQEKGLIVKAVCCNFVRQTINYAIPVIIIYALGYSLHLKDILDIFIMSCLIHMLNALTPLPGDSGWTESAFILIFSIMLGRIDAGTVMILWRAATYYIHIVIGGFTFLTIRYKKAMSSECLKSVIE